MATDNWLSDDPVFTEYVPLKVIAALLKSHLSSTRFQVVVGALGKAAVPLPSYLVEETPLTQLFAGNLNELTSLVVRLGGVLGKSSSASWISPASEKLRRLLGQLAALLEVGFDESAETQTLLGDLEDLAGKSDLIAWQLKKAQQLDQLAGKLNQVVTEAAEDAKQLKMIVGELVEVRHQLIEELEVFLTTGEVTDLIASAMAEGITARIEEFMRRLALDGILPRDCTTLAALPVDTRRVVEEEIIRA